MRSYYSFCALMNHDENCEKYIEQYGSRESAGCDTCHKGGDDA